MTGRTETLTATPWRHRADADAVVETPTRPTVGQAVEMRGETWTITEVTRPARRGWFVRLAAQQAVVDYRAVGWDDCDRCGARVAANDSRCRRCGWSL